MNGDNRIKFQQRIFRQILWIMILTSFANIAGNLLTNYPMNANYKWVVVLVVAFVIERWLMDSPFSEQIMFLLVALLVYTIFPLGWYNSGRVSNNALAYAFLFTIGSTILFKGWKRYFLLSSIIILFISFMYIEFSYPDFLPLHDEMVAFYDRMLQIPLVIFITSGMLIQFADSAHDEHNQLEALSRNYRELAYTDALTGIGNRGYIIMEMERLIRDKVDFIALMIDLDNFKYVNDTFGHLTGDHLLIQLAEKLKSAFGEESNYGRYGGDEFIILIQRPEEEVEEMIADFLTDVRNNGITSKYGATISGGFSHYDGRTALDTFLKKVDQGLYKAKGKGKDQILKA